VGEVIRRVQGGRFIGYYLRWYEHGRRRQLASKQQTYAEARRLLQAIEGRIARGLCGLDAPAAKSPTVAELCERFLAEYSRPRVKDLTKYRAHARTALRRALPILGPLRADAVRQDDVARVRDALSRRAAPNSVRVTVSFLGTMFAWAAKTGLLAQNPVRGVELPQRQDALEYLSHDEVRALLAAAARRAASGNIEDRLLELCVATALHTGLRKGELFGLRWRDLDLSSRRLTVARSFDGAPKSQKARHLRIPDALLSLLTEWSIVCPSTAEKLVFPRKRRRGWSMAAHSGEMLELPALLAEAGCPAPGRPWHALRHTFASHYMMSGGNLLALSQILGHSDIKMTMVYAHLAPDFIGAEMNRIKY
jgi:integrase